MSEENPEAASTEAPDNPPAEAPSQDAGTKPAEPGAAPVRALACHLLALIGGIGWLLGIVVAGLCLVGPLVAWLVWRDRGDLVSEQAAEAVNYNLVCALLGVPVALLAIPAPWLAWLGGAIWLALIGIACWKVLNGQRWRYPVPFRVV